MQPSKDDLTALARKIERHTSKLDKDGYPKEITENALKAIIRSAVRKLWMRSDVKLAFLLSHREPDYSSEVRKWKHSCDKCKDYFKEADVEVDHIKGEKPFRDLKDALAWAISVLCVTKEDLQCLCKPCHTIKSYCEKLGLNWRKKEDWEFAALEKEVILVCKGSGNPEKKWLEVRGVVPESNKGKRKAQVREYLQQNKEKKR